MKIFGLGEINFLQAQKEAALATNLDVGSETECQVLLHSLFLGVGNVGKVATSTTISGVTS